MLKIDNEEIRLLCLSFSRIKTNNNSDLSSENYSYKLIYRKSASSQIASKWTIQNLWDDVALPKDSACVNAKYLEVTNITVPINQDKKVSFNIYFSAMSLI